MSFPDTYHEQVSDRAGAILRMHGHAAVNEDHDKIRALEILMDADEGRYLFGLFTNPLQGARRCSSRSSPDAAARASGRATSTRFSSRWRWS